MTIGNKSSEKFFWDSMRLARYFSFLSGYLHPFCFRPILALQRLSETATDSKLSQLRVISINRMGVERFMKQWGKLKSCETLNEYISNPSVSSSWSFSKAKIPLLGKPNYNCSVATSMETRSHITSQTAPAGVSLAITMRFECALSVFPALNAETFEWQAKAIVTLTPRWRGT